MSRKNPLLNSLVLVAISAVLILLSYFVIKPQQEKRDKDKERAALVFPSLERQKIVEFEIENKGTLLQLKRKAEVSEDWFVTSGPIQHDADRMGVDGVLSTILAAKKESVLQSTDAKAYGLDASKVKLRIPVDGTKKELLLGIDTPVDYMVYAKWSDSPEIFLTTRTLRFGLEKNINELRNKKVFSLPFDELQSLTLTSLGGEGLGRNHVELSKNPQNAWMLGASGARADSALIQQFTEALNTLAVKDFPDPKIKKLLTPLVKLKFQVQKDKPVKEWTLSTRDKKYYWSAEGEEPLYEVAETFKDNFKKDASYFRIKKFIELDADKVSSLLVSDTKKNLLFKKKANSQDWLLKYQVQEAKEEEKAVKPGRVSQIIDSLTQLTASTFLYGKGPYETGLPNPTRIVELRDAEGKTLKTLFFGKKQKNMEWAIKADGMDVAASAPYPLDENLSMDFKKHIVEEAPAPVAQVESPNSAAQTKGKKVKLQNTTKSLKDIRKLPAPIVKMGHKYTAEITLDKGGTLKILFDADKAPYTVSNFLHLSRNGFYNGLKFHRVIENFMAQGGDPKGDGTGGPGYIFNYENSGLKHERGVIAMAHARDPNTNGSQFYITFKPQPHLDGVHTVFGHISEGLNVLDGIKQGDIIKSIEVFEETL